MTTTKQPDFAATLEKSWDSLEVFVRRVCNRQRVSRRLEVNAMEALYDFYEFRRFVDDGEIELVWHNPIDPDGWKSSKGPSNG